MRNPLIVLLMGAVFAMGAGTDAGKGVEGTGDEIRPLLSPQFGRVIRCQARIEAVFALGPVKAPPRGMARLIISSVEGRELPSPVSLIVAGYDPESQAKLREWMATPSPTIRTVLGYELVRMDGIPDGIADHPELRNYPLPAGQTFSIARGFSVLLVLDPKQDKGSSRVPGGPQARHE